jgi:hypothetical protein
MRIVRAMLPALLLAPIAAGCLAVSELKCDQDKIRHALIDLYTNQIIDNLILAANSMPFIQVDYTNATSTVTINESGTLGGSQQITQGHPLNKAARMAAVVRSIQNTFSPTATAGNLNQIAVTANPAITSPEVYDAYLEFLSLPGSLRVSCDPPPECAAHIARQWHGKYYWVPVEYRTEFLRLALLTTAQRGKRLLPGPDFFAVKLTKVICPRTSPADELIGVFKLEMELDKEVPNDKGIVTYDSGDKKGEFAINPFVVKGKVPPTTNRIVVTFNPTTTPALKDRAAVEAALPITAKLKLDAYRPDAQSTDDLLQSMRFQLEQIRFNTIRP